ncbi:major facilitator superfamily domain-containing protein [Mycena rosella]|uniref:Major facilitator superfamily domain-containing protein n=1 Tax=Mycena rosella TaxID=1033263 RepID=A0AAD7D852_MYCRO|nr:major facilitator superfamily domain-containing protein [Mycena rosella]
MAEKLSRDADKNLYDTSDATDCVLERTVWHKLDRWILPVITMFYLLSFLDRTNIGNSRIAGLQKDLNMSNKEYTIALTLTYVAYVASELPSNLVLKRIGPDLLLPTIMILWGLVATLQGVVTSYHGLLACRFFIGLLEGGVPGIVLYLSFFFPRQRLQTRIATFFSAASLSGAFSGILAYGIIRLDGKRGHSSSAWIFLIEGIITITCGLAGFFLLPRSPIHARFLNQQEKDYVAEKLRKDGVMSKDRKFDAFSWSEVGRAFTSPQVALVGIIYFLNGVALYGLAYFTPSIVQSLGFTAAAAQLMTVPPFAVSAVATFAAALISDFYKCRGAMIIVGSVICVAGFGLFLGSSNHHVQYGSLFLSIPGTYLIQPALAAWNANNSAPYIRRATTMALGFIMTNSGGILATWLFGDLSPAPRFTKATQTLLIFSIFMGIFSALNIWYLSIQNRGKANARRNTDSASANDVEELGDRSPWFVYSL